MEILPVQVGFKWPSCHTGARKAVYYVADNETMKARRICSKEDKHVIIH